MSVDPSQWGAVPVASDPAHWGAIPLADSNTGAPGSVYHGAHGDVTLPMPTVPEAPTVLERIGHGADRTVGGIHQLWDEAVAHLSGPDAQSQATGKTQAETDLAAYTKKLNDEEALYQKGRGPNAGIDWASLGGSAAVSAPLMLIPGAGGGMLARAGVGAVQGGVDAAAQPTQTGSVKDRLVNTLIGVGTGGIAAPIAGAVGDAAIKGANTVKNRLAGALTDKSPAAITAAVPELQAAQTALATTPATATISRPALDSLIKEGQQQIAKTGQLDADGLARKANLIANGLTPTKANVTRNSGDWTLERNLQKLNGSPDPEKADVGNQLTAIYTGNDKALAKGLADQGTPFGSSTQEGRGMVVMNDLNGLAKDSQKDVSDVYAAVKEARGSDVTDGTYNVKQALESLRDSPKADPMVDAATRKLKSLGMMDADGNMTGRAATVSEWESLRQHMNAEGAGFGKAQIINAIDKDVIGGLGQDAFSGARAQAKARFDMLKNPATQKALDNFGELSQGKAAQNFVKSQVISAPEQDVDSLLATIGQMKPEARTRSMNAIQGGVMQHLADASMIGENKVSGTKLRDAMDSIGLAKLQKILGPENFAKLDSLKRAAMDATLEPDYSAVNHSNSGTTLLSLVKTGRAIPGVPLVVNENAEKLVEKAALKKQLADSLAAKSTPAGVGISDEVKKKIAQALARSAAAPAATVTQNARQTQAQ